MINDNLVKEDEYFRIVKNAVFLEITDEKLFLYKHQEDNIALYHFKTLCFLLVINVTNLFTEATSPGNFSFDNVDSVVLPLITAILLLLIFLFCYFVVAVENSAVANAAVWPIHHSL